MLFLTISVNLKIGEQVDIYLAIYLKVDFKGVAFDLIRNAKEMNELLQL